MPIARDLISPYLPENFYHIVLKSIDGLPLFGDPSDYYVFLTRFQQFLHPVMDVWAYAYLTNHTHQVCKTKSVDTIKATLEKRPKEQKTIAMKRWLEAPQDEALFHDLVQRQMNSFLVSFSIYINLKYQRKGGIFQKPHKRKLIADHSYLQHAIIYTHTNPQKHQLVKNFMTYPYSSYQPILNSNSHFVKTGDVLDFFDNLENFIQLHSNQLPYIYSNDYSNTQSDLNNNAAQFKPFANAFC
ncbi:MAG: hypothetical protein RLY16_1797 [Bacteroidota bacterium]